MTERRPSKPHDADGLADVTEVTAVPPVAPRASEEITAHTPLSVPIPDKREADLAVGTTLNEYVVETRIGQGGMGTVFSATHPVIGKRAAIKVLRRELCEDPITLERFIDEARVVNQIGHPNIVDVFAFGQLADGRSYLIMEWLRGETLRDRLDRGKLNYLEVCAILKALARALEAAHEKGIAHRDLKPDNVFLVEERDDIPRVKLLDFGIAKLVRADQAVSRTATGAMIGTPQYVAPEQAKGHHIDARVDIYSLGCVAFELLTGRPPFIADNAMEMVAKHLMEAPMRVSSIVDTVPAELDDIVLEMLAKDREDRPTLTEICAVVDRVQRQPAPRDMAMRGDKDSAISIAVTRLVELPDLAARQRRRQRWGMLAILLGGIAMGAVAFMVVSRFKQAGETSGSTQVEAPATGSANLADPGQVTPPVDPARIEVAAPDAAALEETAHGEPQITAAPPDAAAPGEPARAHDHPQVHKTPAQAPHPHKDPPRLLRAGPPHPTTSPPPPAGNDDGDKALLQPGSLNKP